MKSEYEGITKEEWERLQKDPPTKRAQFHPKSRASYGTEKSEFSSGYQIRNY